MNTRKESIDRPPPHDCRQEVTNGIFRAASAASKAADYVLGINRAVHTATEEGHHASKLSAAPQYAGRVL